MALHEVRRLLIQARERAARGDHAGALEDAVRAARLDPGDGQARLLVGQSRLRLGDPRGMVDLDRAEALFIAARDGSGRLAVWQARAAARGSGAGESAGPAVPTVGSPSGPAGAGTEGSVVPGRGPAIVATARIGRPGTVRIRIGLIVVGVRWVSVAAVIAVVTPVLPGLSVPGPPVPAVLVVSACYRMLHAGAVAGIRPLLVRVPPAVWRCVSAGPPVLLGVVRWAGAAVASAWLLQVAGWLTAGPVAYRVAGFVPALGAGAVLGLGVFVTFPVVRPIAR